MVATLLFLTATIPRPEPPGCTSSDQLAVQLVPGRRERMQSIHFLSNNDVAESVAFRAALAALADS